jgi:hypothetical protein
MRKRFGMLALVAALGLSLVVPDAALARRCGRHHRNRGGCVTACNPCGAVSGCGGGCATGCDTGAGAPSPAMTGPPPAPGGDMAPPAPVPAPGA